MTPQTVPTRTPDASNLVAWQTAELTRLKAQLRHERERKPLRVLCEFAFDALLLGAIALLIYALFQTNALLQDFVRAKVQPAPIAPEVRRTIWHEPPPVPAEVPAEGR